MDANDIIRRLQQIAFSDIGKLLSWDAEGVRVRPSCELDEDTVACIASVTETRHAGVVTVHIRMHDSFRALALLAKIKGLDKGVIPEPAEEEFAYHAPPPQSLEQIEASIRYLEEEASPLMRDWLMPTVRKTHAESLARNGGGE